MTRGILIAGNDSSLCRAIETETAKRVKQYAIALIPNRLSEQARLPPSPDSGSQKAGPDTGKNPEQPVRIPLEWNPASPISARTLQIAVENRLSQLSEVILVCSPPSLRRSAAELPLADIEILINDHIKGWFFLVREFAALFRSRQAGTLSLVYADISPDGKDEAVDILGPPALASFQAFTRSLLASAFSEPYLTMGFSCADTGNEAGFASFMFKILDEGNKRNNGKLHKYGKLSFFK